MDTSKNVCEAELKLPHEKEGQLHIFVNNRKFTKEDGVKREMTVAEIAALLKGPECQREVRRYNGHDHSDPIHENVEVVSGDHFAVTRKHVNGGCDAINRIDTELGRLHEGGIKVQRVSAPENAVVYEGLPILGRPDLGFTDVLVPVPPGYPAQMIDWVTLPADSPLIGRVKGAPQEVFFCAGRQWRRISYHPHTNGGAGPWNPQVHGFDSYLGEILSWLGDVQ